VLTAGWGLSAAVSDDFHGSPAEAEFEDISTLPKLFIF
jgi:hypothetical protein